MSNSLRDLDVDAVLDVLATGTDHLLSPGVPVSQLDHALQTAALLAHLHPGDDELAAAGLVHDIGQLLPGGRDETHADQAARAVRRALGERVAAIVGLHIEAKRYLVATEDGYGGVLTDDSVVSLQRQGGALTEEDAAAFLARPWAADAVTLRRVDDSGKAEGLVVRDLASWAPLLEDLARRAGPPRRASALPSSACGPDRIGTRVGAVDVPIIGYCDARFGAVREEFVRNFAERGEVGAAVCASVDGVTVVDLAGGWADPATGAPWRLDTLVDFYSVGKAFVALLALQLVDAGLVALDDPICAVWPEFAAGGKEAATLRHALCHRAGVPAIREPLTDEDLWDWDRMTAALAATAPWWEPGTRHAYHTNTYGHLVGEIVRRVSGQSCGRRLAVLVEPLGADLFVGVPPAEQSRCAEVLFESQGPPAALDAMLEGDARMEMLSYFNPPGYSSMGVVNTSAWRSAEIPSTNGHGSARGVARLYAALLDPGRLLSTALLAEATSPQSTGYCPILHEDVTFGLGFKPTVPRRPFGPNPASFGHFGTGGAVGFADPIGGVAFGYVMNHVIPRWQSTRNRSLIDALYRSL